VLQTRYGQGIFIHMKRNWDQLTKNLIQEHWGLNLHIPIKIDGRLTTTLGTYVFKREKKRIVPLYITLSKDFVTYAEEELIIHILKHELCHFILSQQQLPFDDGTETFERELLRIHALPSRSVSVEYRIHCTRCQTTLPFSTKKIVTHYLKSKKCSCCDDFFEYSGVFYKKIVS